MAEPDPKQIEDIFAQFGEVFGLFGQTSHHLGVTLDVTDAEAAEGCVREIAIQRQSPCTTCEGRGTADPASAPTPCAKCSGKGRLQQTQGFFVVQRTCDECKGAGAVIKNPCSHCAGLRTIVVPGMVTVQVPPGTEHAATLVVTGEGSKGADGSVGDLHVFVLVGGRPDPRQAAFEEAALPADLPRATLRDKQRQIPWSVLAIGAFVLFLAVLLGAR